jgi:hypothetical protein
MSPQRNESGIDELFINVAEESLKKLNPEHAARRQTVTLRDEKCNC